MIYVSKFEKVSKDRFSIDIAEEFNDKYDVETAYNTVSLPVRATSGSAGYDFVSPISFALESGESIKIPTGIRVKIIDGWFLFIAPRSGLGFKYQIGLANTVAIVDSDYYNSENEGHIFIKLVNRGNKRVGITAGDKIAQGIFMDFGLTFDDEVMAKRHGGLGSTGMKV